MQLAVHLLAYNVNRFLRLMIHNAGPWVERIYIAYPKRPFAYIPQSREEMTNPTILSVHLPEEWRSKIEIVEGDWEFEEQARNECLDRARSQGFDWLIIQDADEFFTDQSWEAIRRQLANAGSTTAFKGTWYNFWKSSQYVIVGRDGSYKGDNAGLAIRCLPNSRFRQRREMEAQNIRVLDEPCFHYGYVMSDDEMREKLITWSHAKEFDPQIWFEYKWRRWNPTTRFLNPVWPTGWDRAIRFPLPQPSFAHQFALEFETPERAEMKTRLGMFRYDATARVRNSLRDFKNAWIR